MSSVRVISFLLLLGLSGCGDEPDGVGGRDVVAEFSGPPNLILISVDTLRADRLGCYGHDRETSPTIDGFAEDGTLFEHAMAPSPWTPPSHASMLTGLYPSHHGLKPKDSTMTQDVIREDAFMLSEALQAAGYETGAFVRESVLRERSGFARGFDTFLPYLHGIQDPNPSSAMADATAWIGQERDEPFFAFVHVYDVHSDYVAMPEYIEQFTEPHDGIADGSTGQLHAVRKGELTMTDADAAHLDDLYQAGIRQFDDQFAALLATLEELGLAENTVILFTSDHGEEFFEHGSVLHGRTHYEEVSRVPMIWRGPGVPEGRRVAGPVSLVDIMPTALGLLDIEIPAGLDGVNLGGEWTAPDTRTLFSEADWGNEAGADIKRAVRLDDLKLHYDLTTEVVELYDIALDSAERNNIAEAHPDAVASMLAALDTFMETEQTGPSNPPLSQETLDELRSLGYLE